MTKMEMLLYVACLVLIAVPIWFIKHKVYDDGLIGRLALACIAISAFAVLGQAGTTYFDAWAEGTGYSSAGYRVEWEEAWLVAGFALFITWHLFRFHRRVVRCATPPKDPQGAWPAAVVLRSEAHGYPADHDELADRRVRARRST